MTDQPSKFMECDACRVKPGTPELCASCLHNRSLIEATQSPTTKDFITKNFGRAIKKLGESPTSSWEEEFSKRFAMACAQITPEFEVDIKGFIATERTKAVEEVLKKVNNYLMNLDSVPWEEDIKEFILSLTETK